MNLSFAGIALAIAAALGGYAGYTFTADHYQAVIAKTAAEAAQAVADANQKAQNAASDYEVWKSIQRPKTITITREVHDALQNDPGCARSALPPSVRDALTKAAANASQPLPDDAVPGVHSATPWDLGGRGRGLLGRADAAIRVSGTASGAS